MPKIAPRFALSLIAATALAGIALSPAHGDTSPQPAAPITTQLADLIRQVDIPYQRFTLNNGLRVLVHTDRKTPMVGVTVYFHVGAKNEPRGHTGFAHLYEHLFFGGSENAPKFDEQMEAAGAGSTNGTTWNDRTDYVETVPTGALPLALFLESDRMGHLLGAVTQDKLDKQRGVVENEKRQGDNNPYGLMQYALSEGLFPVGHPYRHATIGSMGDLDAASLGDVRAWFTGHYGPNNAVLVLTGDIDVAAARPLVERYFADIPRGPMVAPVHARLATLPAPVHRDIVDAVAATRLVRAWSGPGFNDPDTPALLVAMRVLGGLASSRLDNALLRGRELAIDTSAEDEVHELISELSVTIDVKPGVSRAAAETALDVEIARFLADGPTADEVHRAATTIVAGRIAALEEIGGLGGKGVTLAEGLTYSGDPAHYKAELARIAALTPAEVHAAARKWLGRPVFALAVLPGERTDKGEAMGGWGDEGSGPVHSPAPSPAAGADTKRPAPPIAVSPPRIAPPVAPVAALTLPGIEHATLSNGIPVALARRSAVPKALVSVDFDAGLAADALDTPGTQAMMLKMLTQGTAAPARNATDVLVAEEQLGAAITTSFSMDASSVQLDALSANLAPSLALMGDMVRRPSFAPGDVARIGQERLAQLAQTTASPEGIALHTLNPLLFGAHPYGQPGDGLGNAAAIAAQTPESLRAAATRWLRPDLARITVVGDITMARLLPLLEVSFGDWHAPASPPPIKPIAAPIVPPKPRIVLIDRPGRPQSFIVGARVLPVNGRPLRQTVHQEAGNQEALDLANQVLGNDFLSRLNSDLREDKAWSYGVESLIRQPLGPRSLLVIAPVQTDRTGDSIAHIIADMAALPATRPITPAELTRTVEGDIRGLPANYETDAQVLSAIVLNDRLGRSETYDTTLPARYRALDAAALNAAARDYLQPAGMIFVVAGDRAKVVPQLTALGLPVDVIPVDTGTTPPETALHPVGEK